ncbi:hypothetical protein [Hyphomicrobium sp. LHD-15]|uniref:hypothetical protein n=1 Tax=Hyphomicrobium sp. LHD-15 TaxID=3072142 RepID=UPI00280C6642|nr:hypothetical protein [Hyphomicrobium sp. LHD-15]MDQ8699506.1 hypothetical protein [Hyphomicrobium sp. LHD-15]
MAARSGVISTSIIVLVLIATAIGALIGLALDGVLPGTRSLAITAGLTATIIASIARYKIVFLGAGKGVDESKVPGVLVVNAAIASIAGSLAAHDLAGLVASPPSSVLVGTFAGLLSAVLMALLMITYHTNATPAR